MTGERVKLRRRWSTKTLPSTALTGLDIAPSTRPKFRPTTADIGLPTQSAWPRAIERRPASGYTPHLNGWRTRPPNCGSGALQIQRNGWLRRVGDGLLIPKSIECSDTASMNRAKRSNSVTRAIAAHGSVAQAAHLAPLSGQQCAPITGTCVWPADQLLVSRLITSYLWRLVENTPLRTFSRSAFRAICESTRG